VKLRITYNSPVVLTFALIAVLVLALENLLGMGFTQWFIAHPHLDGAPAYVGMVTHIFGHQSWEHLLGNFMLILLLGPILEERHGSLGLLLMIVVTALATSTVNMALSNNAVLGASGIVFMMILLASTANLRSGGEIPLTFIAVAVIYLGGELVKSFHSNDGISHLAHLVGGSVGALFGLFGFRASPKRTAKADADLNKMLTAGPAKTKSK
jgi:membrane associated rhomboid family serine protease